jgi:hypothetical protein
MMRFLTRTVTSAALVTGLTWGGVVLPAQAGDSVATILSDGPGMSSAMLNNQRGGSEQNQSAAVSENTINGTSYTGSNTGPVFNQATGMFTVFQNTGNNVVMQSQMNINANLH